MTATTDLDYILTDPLIANVAVSVGASSTVGLVEISDAVVMEGYGPGQVGRTQSVLIRTGSLTGATPGVNITVAGTIYHVVDALAEDDGLVTRIFYRA